MTVISAVQRWLQGRRAIRALWKSDALILIQRNERLAFYEAQRLAARCRARGDIQGFFHWAKVASEVTRLSAVAETDQEVLREIVNDELDPPR